MSEAQWARLVTEQLKGASSPEARFAALATVRADGTAANRMVVVRGFLGIDASLDGLALAGSETLCVVAHTESAKVGEARSGHWAELCWYWVAHGQQLRLRGPLGVVDEDAHADELLEAQRQRQWRELSAATRSMFAWPAPGRAHADTESGEEQRVNTPLDDERPPTSFALLLLAPRVVDWLHLCEPGLHKRWIERRNDMDGTWRRTPVTP